MTTRRRLTQSKLDKAVAAVAAASGAAQIVIEPDGTIRVLPAEAPRAAVVYKAPIRL